MLKTEKVGRPMGSFFVQVLNCVVLDLLSFLFT